ncbi:hypothetical protein GCM10010975_25000 [Comamonas phosphati]|nr:hypothetical protein GCM10010975_25000 [Comamonas phosphati]
MDLWQGFIRWLHTIGLHVDPDTAQAVGQAADSLGDAAGRLGQAAGQMDMGALLALAAALGWASGLRLYAVVFVVGMLGVTGAMPLPGGLHVLAHPLVLVISGGLLFVEFFADKIPVVDSVWDLFQSVLRIPAGAALAAAVFGADNSTMAMAAALMGGTLAATSQAAKTTTRALINTSPEPFSNLGASLAEDTVSVGAIWLALTNPLVFAAALLVVVLVMWLVIWALWRFLKAALRRLRGGTGSLQKT